MPVAFVAAQVEIVDEDGVLVTALAAEGSADESPYFMLQHSHDPDEQDASLGMDEPYFEFCGQQWGWYGELERVELARHRLCVRTSAAAAEGMGNDGVLEIAFDLDDSRFAALEHALRTTFAGRDYFVVVD